MDLAVGQNERRWREWGIRSGLAASGGNGEFEMGNGEWRKRADSDSGLEIFNSAFSIFHFLRDARGAPEARMLNFEC